MAEAAVIPNSPLVTSPINGAVMVANHESAARARAGKAAKAEAYRVAAEAGMLSTAEKLRAGVITELDAYKELVSEQTSIALEGAERNRTAAFSAVSKAIGATDAGRDPLDAPVGGAVLVLSGGAVESLARLLGAKADDGD